MLSIPLLQTRTTTRIPTVCLKHGHDPSHIHSCVTPIPNLNRSVAKIKESAERKRLKAYQYSIKELESFFYPDGRINRRMLAEKVAGKYPVLSYELDREKTIRNPYYIRMFEAVALGSVCFHQLDSGRRTKAM
jgi:hypothetical protein